MTVVVPSQLNADLLILLTRYANEHGVLIRRMEIEWMTHHRIEHQLPEQMGVVGITFDGTMVIPKT